MASRRQTLIQIMILPLLLVLLALWWTRLSTRRPAWLVGAMTGDAPAVVRLPSGAPEEPGAPTAGAPEAPAPQPLVIPDRDPFEIPPPLAASRRGLGPGPATISPRDQIPLPPLTVQGVFWGTRPPKVIINDQILTEGDTIDGVRVLTIGAGDVTVEYQNQRTVIAPPAAAGRPTEPPGD